MALPNPNLDPDSQYDPEDPARSSIGSLTTYPFQPSGFDSVWTTDLIWDTSTMSSLTGSAETVSSSLWNTRILDPRFFGSQAVTTNTSSMPDDFDVMLAAGSGTESLPFDKEFCRPQEEDLSLYSQFRSLNESAVPNSLLSYDSALKQHGYALDQMFQVHQGIGLKYDTSPMFPVIYATQQTDEEPATPTLQLQSNDPNPFLQLQRSGVDGSEPSYAAVQCTSVANSRLLKARTPQKTTKRSSSRLSPSGKIQKLYPVNEPTQRLSSLAISACMLWLEGNNQQLPQKQEIFGLSLAFSAPYEPLRRWFKERANSIKHESFASSAEERERSDVQSILHNSEVKCTPSNDQKLLSSLGQDRSKPFACTNRCGMTFKRKGDWKRHEERNFSQAVWRCWKLSCPLQNRVFNRKDKFRNHLRSTHGTNSFTEEDLDIHRIPLDTTFDRQCIFRACDEKFNHWNQRLDHIWKHFCKPWNVSQWRNSQKLTDADESESTIGLDSFSSDTSNVSQADPDSAEGPSDGAEDQQRRRDSDGAEPRQTDTGRNTSGSYSRQWSTFQGLVSEHRDPTYSAVEAYTSNIDRFEMFLVTGISRNNAQPRSTGAAANKIPPTLEGAGEIAPSMNEIEQRTPKQEVIDKRQPTLHLIWLMSATLETQKFLLNPAKPLDEKPLLYELQGVFKEKATIQKLLCSNVNNADSSNPLPFPSLQERLTILA